MDILVRKATESDFPEVLSMIKQLAEYEKSPDNVTNTVSLMKEEKHLFTCFVAETPGKEIVGMALYFFAYFTWVGKSLYLEDIYVKESFRRKKVGESLLKKVFEVAKTENCKRVRWQVLSWNENAINFYNKSGAEISSDWLNCTFNYNGIRNFNI